MHIRPSDLTAKFGEHAPLIWAKICQLGGFGRLPFTVQGINIKGFSPETHPEIAFVLGIKKAKAKAEPVQAEAPVITEETQGENN
jgi:hypothetical protein